MTRSFTPNVVAAAALSAGAVGLLCASPQIAGALRTAMRDATRPGQSVLAAAIRYTDETLEWLRRGDPAEAQRLRAELEQWKLHARQLALEAASARETLDELREIGWLAEPAGRTGSPSYRQVPTEPLVVAELITASVLGEEHAREWRAGRFIDKGTLDGIPEAALVLEATDPVIDAGRTAGLAAGQPVYAGRCVVGRVAHVGRWMSTVQPVTHPGYRGVAQVVRRTAEGSVFGARGILAGAGEPLCRLTIIDATASIEVGDEVYTGQRDGTLPSPMYYGKVVSAELNPRTLEWDIRVEPAVPHIEGRTVAVLRRTLNPLRVSAQ